MPAFSIDPEDLAARKDRAQERALKREGARLASNLGAGKLLDDEDLATLLLSSDVPTEALLDVAAAQGGLPAQPARRLERGRGRSRSPADLPRCPNLT